MGPQGRDSVDGATRAAYSGGMISEFQDLSDKIDQLAEMTHALRRENAQLRQANAALVVENMGYQRRLSEASGRIVALLEKVPSLESGAASDKDDEIADGAEQVAGGQPEKEDAR
jgi:regulator of replication initiation timing